MKRPTLILVLLVTVAVALPACGSTNSGAGNGTDRSTGSGTDRSTGSGSSGNPLDRPDVQAGTGGEFTGSDRALIDTAWRAFKQKSPTWPELREDWIALGPKATNTLVENLYRAMVVSRIRHSADWYDISRKELMVLGDLAVPTLVGVLANPTWLNPVTGQRESLPSENVTEILDIVVIAGPSAITPLTRLTNSEHPGVRRGAVEALGEIRDPRALPAITKMLDDGRHWADRMAAARAAGYIGTPAAEDALIGALDDPDESVVQEAARSLARLNCARALTALDSRARRAESAGEYRILRACQSAASSIRGGR